MRDIYNLICYLSNSINIFCIIIFYLKIFILILSLILVIKGSFFIVLIIMKYIVYKFMMYSNVCMCILCLYLVEYCKKIVFIGMFGLGKSLIINILFRREEC